MTEQHLTLGTTRIIVSPTDVGNGTARMRERATAARLAAILTERPAVEIMHDQDGAPFIDGGPHISISHARHMVAVAVDPCHSIGIDVEQERTAQLRRVADRVLSPDELAIYGAEPHLLTLAWTLKEALYKAAGVPGADWRTDLQLPLTPDGREAIACGRRATVIHTARFDDGTTLSVVRIQDT